MYCNVDLLDRTVHSTNQFCIYGAVTKWYGTNSASQSRLEKSARRSLREIQIKQEDLWSLVDIPRLPQAALEDDGWGRSTSMCKEYTAPRNQEDSRSYASIDAKRENGPVLIIGIATFIDVPGIEVQVLSLSSTGSPAWIWKSRGHEGFVNEIHRHNSEIVNYSSSLCTKEENFDNVGFESSKAAVVNHKQGSQGSQDSNNVKTKDESSGVLRETVASTVRVNPGLSESSSGGSSIPTSIHPVTKSIYIQKEIPKGVRIWTAILRCQKAKGIPLKLASPSVAQM